MRNYRRLLFGLLHDIRYSGSSFFHSPLIHVQDKHSVLNLLYLIDKANGYAYTGTPSASAVSANVDVRELDFDYYRVGQIQEKYAGLEEGDENPTENQTTV